MCFRIERLRFGGMNAASECKPVLNLFQSKKGNTCFFDLIQTTTMIEKAVQCWGGVGRLTSFESGIPDQKREDLHSFLILLFLPSHSPPTHPHNPRLCRPFGTTFYLDSPTVLDSINTLHTLIRFKTVTLIPTSPPPDPYPPTTHT